MGKPSKYLDLPELSFGREETVTLKRARRVRPQRTKKARARLSSGVRRPRAKAATAGATPKEIYSLPSGQRGLFGKEERIEKGNGKEEGRGG